MILIPTTRSPKKSRETIERLRAHLAKAAKTSTKLRARVGPDYDPKSAISRVHLLSIEIDLCKLPSVYAAAERLVNGQVRDPTFVVAGGRDVAIPRLDAALFNAGYGGWSGLDWLEFARQIITVGLIQAVTFPSYKVALPSNTMPPQELPAAKEGGDEAQPELAEVFCANTFGHYILAHELMPLLTRSSATEQPGRVVWTSSIDAETWHLDFDDFQGLRSKAPYESSKRITDIASLTSDLPRVQKIASGYFASPGDGSKPIRPRFYLSHPGIVCTPLFPLHPFLFFFYYYTMVFSRLVGSPWHPVETYLGACATAWLALESQETLDAKNAQRVKWGSSADWRRNAAPKKTEVQGWGWEGKVQDAQALERDGEPGVLHALKGRKWDAALPTEEDIAKFEEDGVKCWTELERLRGVWEGLLGRRKC